MSRAAFPALALLALSACGDKAENANRQAPAAAASPASSAPVAAPRPVAQPSESRDPQQVLIAWAKVVSLKDWDAAYLYWGDHGARSGQTLNEFKTRWGMLRAPDLEIRGGKSESAAGSLFYTAPVTIVDGQRRISGKVVLRRANDVPGASSEQLRWHIESDTFAF